MVDLIDDFPHSGSSSTRWCLWIQICEVDEYVFKYIFYILDKICSYLFWVDVFAEFGMLFDGVDRWPEDILNIEHDVFCSILHSFFLGEFSFIEVVECNRNYIADCFHKKNFNLFEKVAVVGATCKLYWFL